jgi:phosphoadenosine phosphosulfate reductase
MTDAELQQVSGVLEGSSPGEILRWAADRLPRIALATGFGAEGCVLIDLIGRYRLAIDVFTLDTGLLFAETYELWRHLEQRYRVQIRAVRPSLSLEQQERDCGARLWEADPDRCCEIRKVLPLRAALAPFEAWITAIRRDQSPDRAKAQVVERDRAFGLIKVNPLAGWTSDNVWAYLREHEVPTNALHERGYTSIGCAPCTSPVAAGEDPRAGRWRGRAKTECGLHARASRAFNASSAPPGPKDDHV